MVNCWRLSSAGKGGNRPTRRMVFSAAHPGDRGPKSGYPGGHDLAAGGDGEDYHHHSVDIAASGDLGIVFMLFQEPADFPEIALQGRAWTGASPLPGPIPPPDPVPRPPPWPPCPEPGTPVVPPGAGAGRRRPRCLMAGPGYGRRRRRSGNHRSRGGFRRRRTQLDLGRRWGLDPGLRLRGNRRWLGGYRLGPGHGAGVGRRHPRRVPV